MTVRRRLARPGGKRSHGKWPLGIGSWIVVLALASVLGLTACQVTTQVAVTVAANGSGYLRVTATFDAATVAAVEAWPSSCRPPTWSRPVGTWSDR